MIATFDDEDIFDELVLFLKSKNNVKKTEYISHQKLFGI